MKKRLIHIAIFVCSIIAIPSSAYSVLFEDDFDNYAPPPDLIGRSGGNEEWNKAEYQWKKKPPDGDVTFTCRTIGSANWGQCAGDDQTDYVYRNFAQLSDLTIEFDYSLSQGGAVNDTGAVIFSYYDGVDWNRGPYIAFDNIASVLRLNAWNSSWEAVNLLDGAAAEEGVTYHVAITDIRFGTDQTYDVRVNVGGTFYNLHEDVTFVDRGKTFTYLNELDVSTDPGFIVNIGQISIESVPEPSAPVIFCLGLAGLAGLGIFSARALRSS